MSRTRSGRTARPALRLLPLLAALALTACGQAVGETPALAPTTAVDGRWSLTSATDRSGPLQGAEATLRVADAVFVGQAPCGGYTGDVTVTGGDAVRFVGLGAVDCTDPSLSPLHTRYVDALRQVTRATSGTDRLVLTGDGVELTFSRDAPPPAAPVEGSRWTLMGTVGGSADDDVTTGADHEEPAFLRLDGAGRLEGRGGCRGLTASYRLEGGVLTVGDLVLGDAPAGCTAPARALDDALESLLSQPTTVSVEAGRMTLLRDGTGFGFAAAP